LSSVPYSVDATTVNTFVLTFRQYINESSVAKTGAALAIAARIAVLNRQISQDKNATKAEKILSSELFWLAGLVGLTMTSEKR
jgi:hypothetical protein